MNYHLAKIATVNMAERDPNILREAASFLLASLDATAEDLDDAASLIERAQEIEREYPI